MTAAGHMVFRKGLVEHSIKGQERGKRGQERLARGQERKGQFHGPESPVEARRGPGEAQRGPEEARRGQEGTRGGRIVNRKFPEAWRSGHPRCLKCVTVANSTSKLAEASYSGA